MKSFTPSHSLLSLALLASVSYANASEAEHDQKTESISKSETVVVTANRTAKTVDSTISTVAVITEEDIKKSQARSVQELLQGRAGLHFTNNGGRGKSTSLFVRGTNSDHVVVLIDGIKVGSATLGSVPFQDLPIDQVERIEVVRGARSSLYGSEAIGGVIQIFTRKADDESRVFLNLSAGNEDTYEGSAGISAGKNGAFFNLSATGSQTTGFDSCKSEAAGTGGCFNDEPDEDGYETHSFAARLGKDFSGGSSIAFSAQQTRSENEFDGSFQNSGITQQRVLGLSTSLVLGDVYTLKLTAGQSRDHGENFLNDNFVTKFNTERETVNLQNDLQLGRHLLLTFGGDYQNDKVTSTTAYGVNDRENYGGFVQAGANFGGLSLEASVRHDDNEHTGSDKTFGTGLAIDLNDQLQFVASFGTAFKAPTFNQLYFPFFGSPNLKPEESRNYEFGVRSYTKTQSFAATIFKNDVDNLIVYDSSTFSANNIDAAEIQGLEIEFGQQINEFLSASTDVTLMDPRNTSTANDGNLLPRRAKRTARIALDYAKNDWSIGTTFNFVGARFDDAGNNRKLSNYETVDLRFQKQVNESLTLQAKVTNLTDSDYETTAFYNQQGRSVLFTLRFQPN